MSVTLANLTNDQLNRAREGFQAALIDIAADQDIEDALEWFLQDLKRRRHWWGHIPHRASHHRPMLHLKQAA